jgi:DNA-binding NarL/FixJ family response regulator
MRAIIIERWAILRYGLRSVLGQAGYPVLSAVASAKEGLEAVRGARGVDLITAGTTDDQGIVELVAALVEEAPEARVVVLADQPDRACIDALLGCGAAGILGRLAEGSELVDALDRVQRGERVLSKEVIDTLVGGIDPRRAIPPPLAARAPNGLTIREREILSYLVTGATNKDIAGRLFIGEATVKTHLASAYAKLNVANRHQAVARGIELGLVAWRAHS